jgi:sec-independent protein translocase protein TatB
VPDINGGELLVLVLVALVVVGPERLPRYAAQLGSWVRVLRNFLVQAKDRVAEELGEEAKDLDWASMDPRQYDPRRIVREALLDPPTPVPTTGRSYTSGAAAAAAAAAAAGAGLPAPFDDEAT